MKELAVAALVHRVIRGHFKTGLLGLGGWWLSVAKPQFLSILGHRCAMPQPPKMGFEMPSSKDYPHGGQREAVETLIERLVNEIRTLE